MTDRDPDIASKYEVDNHEPSAWLRQAIRNRLAELGDSARLASMLGIIAFNLNDTEEGTRADRECDRCGAYTAPGTVFYTGTSQPSAERLGWPWSQLLAGHQIIVAYGLCAACAALEVGPLDQLEDLS